MSDNTGGIGIERFVITLAGDQGQPAPVSFIQNRRVVGPGDTHPADLVDIALTPGMQDHTVTPAKGTQAGKGTPTTFQTIDLKGMVSASLTRESNYIPKIFLNVLWISPRKIVTSGGIPFPKIFIKQLLPTEPGRIEQSYIPAGWKGWLRVLLVAARSKDRKFLGDYKPLWE